MTAALAMTMSYERQKKKEGFNRAWMLRGRDIVAPEHRPVHAALDRWGAWCRSGGSGPGSCSSAESYYEVGGREVKRPVISLPPNPLYPRIQRAVWLMTIQHGDTIRQYYVRKRPPPDICSLYAIRFEDWAKWIGDARGMVLFILQREGVVLDAGV